LVPARRAGRLERASLRFDCQEVFLILKLTFFFRDWIIKSGLYIRRCTQPIITELHGTVHKRVKKAATGNKVPTKVNDKNCSILY
jgi:hypothetical protein